MSSREGCIEDNAFFNHEDTHHHHHHQHNADNNQQKSQIAFGGSNATSSSTRQREDFSSKGTLSYIALGFYKNKECNHDMVYKESFLTHLDPIHNDKTMSRSLYMLENPQGINTTKFGKGFYRRTEDKVHNPLADFRKEYKKMSLERADSLQKIRTQQLIDIDNKTGFNLINHHLKGSGYRDKVESIRMVPNEGLTNETPNRGKVILRDSMGKFFIPQASGPQHHYRQQVLAKEGINQDRFSAVLEAGKKDLPSFGIEDNFSKNQYGPTSEITKRGLYEIRNDPAKYTPRLDPNNPSGYPDIVRGWNTNAKEVMKLNEVIAAKKRQRVEKRIESDRNAVRALPSFY